jgi:effector-binding domain-containing protein
MIDPPRILQTSAQSTAIIHLTIPRSDMRKVMGPALAELRAALASQKVVPTGPWFARHLTMKPDVFDFEIGFPVTEAVATAGRMTVGTLPASNVARTVLHGSFEGLGAAWAELDAWVVAQGRKPGPSLVETYLTGPADSPDAATWATELTRPLAD